MTTRIGNYIRAGSLRNSRRNSVVGWLEFAPDFGIHIELTGNLSGKLAGKNLRFKVSDLRLPVPTPEELPEFVDELANRQIGVVGRMELVRSTGNQKATENEGKSASEALCLRWYSQNGLVEATIPAPNIEYFLESDKEGFEAPFVFDQADFKPGRSTALDPFDELSDSLSTNPEREDSEEDDEDDDDPYGLFDESLDQAVADSLGSDTDLPYDDQTPEQNRPTWQEVLPELDPETAAMFHQWDEIFEGSKDEPVSYLFETPMHLPPPDKIRSEEEAHELVTQILAQLALLNVALDVCEHFSERQVYDLLVREILPTAKVHPDLKSTEIIQHYTTSDFCSTCEAEYDAEEE
ncbi:MAG: hypothetical protein KDB03_04180 [Planctomycetales bacterium]|nr:hypothetical protein [Planctomycetales bacterium]